MVINRTTNCHHWKKATNVTSAKTFLTFSEMDANRPNLPLPELGNLISQEIGTLSTQTGFPTTTVLENMIEETDKLISNLQGHGTVAVAETALAGTAVWIEEHEAEATAESTMQNPHHMHALTQLVGELCPLTGLSIWKLLLRILKGSDATCAN
ncbi:hypothetical protein AAFF_G00263930 [Aldrovandia affinis]|uniref:Uncharacterized protein n=1 Tax=Aldrovandia affinis TaxID=143900 RepID=A0AAD7WT88_9TELE|nr:hypothetical protein AAFF_G00263930 [Aldrovandia affinis]